MSKINEKKVVISEMFNLECGYPDKIPFHPPCIFPEMKNLRIKLDIDESNLVYNAVRNAFILMELDKNHIGTTMWNPLSNLVKQGDTVVIKPNFVIDTNKNDKSCYSTITHGSVIRAVIDYVLLALQGKGKVIVADAPQMNCDFDNLINKNGMKGVSDYYKKELTNTAIEFELIDLRRERTVYKNGVVWDRIPLEGDPRGYTIVDLKRDSEFCGLNPRKFYGADYNRKQTIKAHSYGHHKYFISNTILQSDVIICIPKLKVHRKVGVTLNMKNMVGINGDKNYLVHYQVGTPIKGGDEFSVESKVVNFDRKIMDLTIGQSWKYGKYIYARYLSMKKFLGIKEPENTDIGGDWYGNDTTWRMTMDLNKLLLYTDKNGKIINKRNRKYISIVDGIIGGEGEGPLEPRQVKSGVIILGTNPIATDIVAATYMGLDYNKIKTCVAQSNGNKMICNFATEEIQISSTQNKYNSLLKEKNSPYKYKVPHGWRRFL